MEPPCYSSLIMKSVAQLEVCGQLSRSEFWTLEPRNRGEQIRWKMHESEK